MDKENKVVDTHTGNRQNDEHGAEWKNKCEGERKKKGRHTPEIYITREKTEFFVTDDKELEKFYGLVNQVLAINYGYWGAVWRNYIYETASDRYWVIWSEQRLYSRIAEIDLEAQKLYDRSFAEFFAASGNKVTAEQKAKAIVKEKVIKNPLYLE